MTVSRLSHVLVIAAASGVICGTGKAAVTVIGGQYQEDNVYPEYRCLWHTDCHYDVPGCNVHVYLKNTGPSSVTITDVTLAGYSLATVLKLNASQHNARSIYYYWDNPPAAILNAGEPAWYKADPSTIPAGGVAQVVVRLRRVPATKPVSIGVVTTGGTATTTVPVSAGDPVLASVSFSSDRRKAYLSWRRNGGAAPTTIKMDDVDVTASTTTVGDAAVNYAVSVLSFDTPLANMSYHVYQGVYSDGKTATASLRTWVNPFVHGCWGAKSGADGDLAAARAYIDDATNRGVNAMIVNGSNIVNDLTGTASGRQYCEGRGFGFVIDSVNKWSITTPRLWFLNDEPDAEEDNVSHTFCGTGLRLPCGGNPMGIIAQDMIAKGETFRASSPTTPTTVNLDGTFKPSNYYTWGQAVDVLMADPYYQRRLQDAYWRDQDQIPLYEKATYIYAVSKALARAAEPNPAITVLYSCSWRCDTGKCDEQYVGMIWPFPTPESKRIEAYYALAAGAKGLAYWWWKKGYPSNGLDAGTPQALALWKEMGLYGVEIKTIRPLLVTSHPVDMTLSPSTHVWARALTSGTDAIILLVVNDNYYNDFSGCHYTPVSNASVVATLPSWMRSSPTAFEVRPSGLYNVTTSLAGSNLTVNLGTLNLTRMIVVTTDPSLRATIQQRYEQEVWPGVCAFAPEHCLPQQNPPSIAQHPSNQTVSPGGSTSFSVVASGSSPLSYQWQKDRVDITDGGHYSGATTPGLTVSSADRSDAGNYRCVVTGGCGSVTSNEAVLTVGPAGVPGDFDQDGDVDQTDFGHLQECLDTLLVPATPGCADADLDRDPAGAVDQRDVLLFLECMTGPGVAGDPNCAN